MNNKTILVIIVVLIAGALVGVYLSKNIKKQQVSKEASQQISPSENLTSYSDPSGFSLSYPENLRLDKKEELDNTTYADLKLVSDKVSGSVSVNIIDTKLKNIDEWASKNAGGSVGREVSLGGIAGQEFTIGEKVVTVAIDKGVLFTLEANLKENKDFWQKTYQTVLTSFVFVSSATQNTGNASSEGGDDVVFEGEEVVK